MKRMHHNFGVGGRKPRPYFLVSYAESSELAELEGQKLYSANLLNKAIRSAKPPAMGYDKNDIEIHDGEGFALKMRFDIDSDGEHDKDFLSFLYGYREFLRDKKRRDPDIQKMIEKLSWAISVVEKM